MNKKTVTRARRDDTLSRERIIEAAIDLLDREGERGLTFQALSAQLVTGPGAIYGHIANKADLLTAACDAIVARTVMAPLDGATPQAAIRAVALALFDAMDAHPAGKCRWYGSSNASGARSARWAYPGRRAGPAPARWSITSWA